MVRMNRWSDSARGHQSGLYANPRFYCDGKVIVKSIDLKPYIERRRARLAKQKNRLKCDSFFAFKGFYNRDSRVFRNILLTHPFLF